MHCYGLLWLLHFLGRLKLQVFHALKFIWILVPECSFTCKSIPHSFKAPLTPEALPLENIYTYWFPILWGMQPISLALKNLERLERSWNSLWVLSMTLYILQQHYFCSFVTVLRSASHIFELLHRCHTVVWGSIYHWLLKSSSEGHLWIYHHFLISRLYQYQ